MYSVKLITENGQGLYLSVKGRTSWKTKRIAQAHAKYIQTCIDKRRNLWNAVSVEVKED
jgi:hypothetical protein